MNDLVTDEQIEVAEVAEVAEELPVTEDGSIKEPLTTDEKIKIAKEEIERLRNKLISEKFELLLDESEKENVQKYLSKIQSFVNIEIAWSGIEFFAVESLMNEIRSLSKTLKGKEIPSFSFFSIETFVRLTNSTSGKGYREIAKRKSVLKAFNNTYSMINDNYIHKLKDTENELTELYNQKDLEEREIQNQELIKSLKAEEPVYDIPKTLNEILRFNGDVKEVLINMVEQIKNKENV